VFTRGSGKFWQVAQGAGRIGVTQDAKARRFSGRRYRFPVFSTKPPPTPSKSDPQFHDVFPTSKKHGDPPIVHHSWSAGGPSLRRNHRGNAHWGPQRRRALPVPRPTVSLTAPSEEELAIVFAYRGRVLAGISRDVVGILSRGF